MTVDEAVNLDNDCQNCVTEPYKQDLEEHIENNDQEALIRVSLYNQGVSLWPITNNIRP
jgi:hypothetical protein